MKKDVLEQFRNARENLERERQEIVSRVTEIDAVLAGQGGSAPPLGRSAVSVVSRRGRRGTNTLSMLDAAKQVLAKGPRHIQELLQSIQGLGYQFTGKNPKNSLSVMLYTNKKVFKGKRGTFSLR